MFGQIVVDDSLPENTVLVMGPVEIEDVRVLKAGEGLVISGLVDTKKALKRSALIRGLGQD